MTAQVVLGRIDESFHQVAAAVVEEVLLRLGHTVEVREGPHPQMYPLLQRGELQLFADSWLPGGHGVYWEQICDQVVEERHLRRGTILLGGAWLRACGRGRRIAGPGPT